jgi:PAP2 superfamily
MFVAEPVSSAPPPAPAPAAVRVWRRVGRRQDGRTPLWIELLVIGWLFWLYDVINNWAPVRQLFAMHNAASLISFEHSLDLDPELAINHWLAAHHTLGEFASSYYFFAHALVTFGLLAWLWWKRPAIYPRLRAQLVIVNLIAFVVFWRYPLAPPRMFPQLGFDDILASAKTVVSWHSGALVHDADQLAAMPSLHVAWASWSAVVIWQSWRTPLARAVAIAYPLLTSLVVIATGNHFVLDVLAGAATVPAAIATQRAGGWLLARYRRRGRLVVTEPGEHAVRGLPAQP